MYGPSVPVHLTSFMEGRGRPGRSGPLDGDGRRSIYLDVRRNFLNPMFLAFDAPVPFSTMGRRNVSNVPAQASTLMNDPMVARQARLWAERVLAGPGRSTRAAARRLVHDRFRPATDRAGSPRQPGVPRPARTRRVTRRLGRPLPCFDQYERIYFRRLNLTAIWNHEAPGFDIHALPTICGHALEPPRDAAAVRQRIWCAGRCRVASRAGVRGGVGDATVEPEAVAVPNGSLASRNPLAPRPPHFAAKATSVIFLFMDGGPSQVDTFDPKPRLAREHGQPIKVKTHPTQFNNVGNVLACPWKFRRYGESGIPVSDLFPHVGPVRRRPGDRAVDGLELLRAHQRQLLPAHRQRASGPAQPGRLGDLRPGERMPGPARLRRAQRRD